MASLFDVQEQSATRAVTQPKVAEDEQHSRLRVATEHDVPTILRISSSATKKFSSIRELADLAEDEETPYKIRQWLGLGRIYLAEEAGEGIGIIAAYPMDDALYIAEVSVSSNHQRKGIGGMLLEAVFAWAMANSNNDTIASRVSLTTYADVKWSGPWYRKYGFEEVDPNMIGPHHAHKMEIDEEERALVRPGYRWCCMLWIPN